MTTAVTGGRGRRWAGGRGGGGVSSEDADGREKGAAARKKAGELHAAAEMTSTPGGPQLQAMARMVGKWNRGRGTVDHHPRADGASEVR
uniref:Uncharacterized protein n=1 Tax=Oryza punctata TaxID=4537 RepID=A0A0E0JLA5_ORYPU